MARRKKLITKKMTRELADNFAYVAEEMLNDGLRAECCQPFIEAVFHRAGIVNFDYDLIAQIEEDFFDELVHVIAKLRFKQMGELAAAKLAVLVEKELAAETQRK